MGTPCPAREGTIGGMRFTGVLPPDLATGRYWPQIAALVARALPYGRGEYALDDIRDGIERRQMFAIGAVEDDIVTFVATCTLARYPRKTVLYVQYGAGANGAALKHTLIDAAKTLGADWIETRCRASVARLYRKVGFDVGYCVPILEILP